MMQLQLTHADIRKLATMFRRPGVALLSSAAGNDPNTLHLQLRLDLAAFVNIVAKLGGSAPVVVDVWFELAIEGESTVCIHLAGLDLDRSELPMLMRPLVRNSMARKQLFAAVKPNAWLQVDAEAEILSLNLNGLLKEKRVPLAGTLEDIGVTEQGLQIKLADMRAS